MAVESASNVLSYLDILTKSSELTSSVREALQNELAMDFFLASLVLCLETRSLNNGNATLTASGPALVNGHTAQQHIAKSESTKAGKTKDNLLALVEQALENYFSRLPSSTVPLCPLYLSMVLNSVKTKESLQVAETQIKKDLRRMVTIMRNARNAEAAEKRMEEFALPDFVGNDFGLPGLSPNFEQQLQSDLGLFPLVADSDPAVSVPRLL